MNNNEHKHHREHLPNSPYGSKMVGSNFHELTIKVMKSV